MRWLKTLNFSNEIPNSLGLTAGQSVGAMTSFSKLTPESIYFSPVRIIILENTALLKHTHSNRHYNTQLVVHIMAAINVNNPKIPP